MTDWVKASEKLPDLGSDDRSELVEFKAGDAINIGFLVKAPGGLEWVSQDEQTWIPEPRPVGLAEPHKRWVTHWRRL